MTHYLPYILVGCTGGRGKLHQPGHHSYGASKDFIVVHTVQLKQMIKAHFSGKLVSNGISDVVTASVYPEKTSLKNLMKMNIIIITEKPFTSK